MSTYLMSKQIYSDEETALLRSVMSPRMKAARLALKFTQTEAAKRIGISAEFYARMERGNAMPSVSTLRKVAAAFQCSVDYLFGADSTGGPPAMPIPPPTRVKDSRSVNFIVERVRDNPDLTRLLTLVLKIRARYEGRDDDDENSDEQNDK